MKKIIFLFFSIIVPYRGISEIDPKQIISTITGTPEFLKEGMSAIASLGLACGRPDQWGLFVSEINKILLGIAEIISETATQLAFKKDYPTVCHVLTQEQLDLYKDYDDNSKKNKKCVRTKRIDKHLPLYKHYEVLSPHYYWPKYFIEVTEKGYDPHDKFAKDNGMFKFNRKIADIYEKIINPQDVLKLIQSVLTGEVLLKGVNAALNALPDKMTGDANIKIGKPKDNFASIIPTLLLSVPLEKYRLIGSKKDSMSTYDASIWPIALSYAMAKNFTVCGPSLKQSGKHPGGSFDALGLAATCPMALSSDAATLWDTGFLDYMDPEAISAMVASSNPATCIADSVRTYFADEEARDTTTTSNPNDPDKKPHNEIPESSMGDGLLKCSYPITGTIESVLKKSIAMTDPKKWKQAKCTVWGPLAPRASFSVQDTDYSYANTAFKFKLFAHELFGVKRGEAEKWSLAYPWEGDGRDENLGEIPSEVTKNMPIDKLEKTTKIASKLSDGVLSKISKQETKKENNSRSHSLYFPGDPIMVNASLSLKQKINYATTFVKDQAKIGLLKTNEMAAVGIGMADLIQDKKGEGSFNKGDRRIFTIWERISCPLETGRFTLEDKITGLTVEQYDKCDNAIKFVAYKFVQLKLIRKICDLLGQEIGLPWK